MHEMNALRKSHFELFGLPERYGIDAADLDAAYRRVQGAVHPDRFAGGSDAERRVAMQMATHVNEAYRTLRDPARRAAYLCALHGVELQVESNTAMTPAFLVQQMQWREELEEAREQRSEPALQAIRDELDARRGDLLGRLGRAIDEQGDYHLAAQEVRQLMFLDRFAQDIDAAHEHLLQA
jgi:molecular chaperone HscB